jgi:hypothetical protein
MTPGRRARTGVRLLVAALAFLGISVFISYGLEAHSNAAGLIVTLCNGTAAGLALVGVFRILRALGSALWKMR